MTEQGGFFSLGRVRVKICGVTREADALDAISAGADALGFNFWPGSKRCIRLEDSADWISQLPNHVARVAVVVDPDDLLAQKLRECGLFEAIQFHGGETPERCIAVGGRTWIKAVRGAKQSGLAARYGTPWMLLDAASAQAPGGTGDLADWSLTREFATAGKHLILAGGLHAGNVSEAVRATAPHAVDVASGVEISPGIKDRSLMRDFIAAAKAA